jgi:ferrous iron transport protein A
MKLSECITHNRYIVRSIALPENIQKRLEALGMTYGTTVDILNAKDKGALIVKVRGTRLAIGYGISDNIEVEV